MKSLNYLIVIPEFADTTPIIEALRKIDPEAELKAHGVRYKSEQEIHVHSNVINMQTARSTATAECAKQLEVECFDFKDVAGVDEYGASDAAQIPAQLRPDRKFGLRAFKA